jgi:hypothetical protein
MRATLDATSGAKQRTAVQGQFLNFDGTTLPW